ncbi:MAG: GNAT family N-acetyltransferase [Bdellovibrionales bacterium]
MINALMKTLYATAALTIAKVLNKDDYLKVKKIRLEALENDGRYFATSYEEEKSYSDAQWRQWIAESPENCVIGVFVGDELVGITTVTKWEEDVTGKTAKFGRSYIRPDSRGQGLANLLYQKRMDWAKQQRRYTSAVVFHRDGNELSKHINTKFGAKYYFTRPMRWANGETADAHWYKTLLAERKKDSIEKTRKKISATPVAEKQVLTLN